MAITKTQVLQEYKNGIEYGKLKIVIPTADVLNAGTQIKLIDAPGSDKVIEVKDASAGLLTFVSAAYTTHTTIELITDTADQCQFLGVSYLTMSSAHINFLNRNTTFTIATDKQLIANKGLYFVVASGNPVVGDSDLVIYLDYEIYTQ